MAFFIMAIQPAWAVTTLNLTKEVLAMKRKGMLTIPILSGVPVFGSGHLAATLGESCDDQGVPGRLGTATVRERSKSVTLGTERISMQSYSHQWICLDRRRQPAAPPY